MDKLRHFLRERGGPALVALLGAAALYQLIVGLILAGDPPHMEQIKGTQSKTSGERKVAHDAFKPGTETDYAAGILKWDEVAPPDAVPANGWTISVRTDVTAQKSGPDINPARAEDVYLMDTLVLEPPTIGREGITLTWKAAEPRPPEAAGHKNHWADIAFCLVERSSGGGPWQPVEKSRALKFDKKGMTLTDDVNLAPRTAYRYRVVPVADEKATSKKDTQEFIKRNGGPRGVPSGEVEATSLDIWRIEMGGSVVDSKDFPLMLGVRIWKWETALKEEFRLEIQVKSGDALGKAARVPDKNGKQQNIDFTMNATVTDIRKEEGVHKRFICNPGTPPGKPGHRTVQETKYKAYILTYEDADHQKHELTLYQPALPPDQPCKQCQ